jgi:hypothetical protein
MIGLSFAHAAAPPRASNVTLPGAQQHVVTLSAAAALRRDIVVYVGINLREHCRVHHTPPTAITFREERPAASQ